MVEEDSAGEDGKMGRTRLLVIMVVLIVVGIALYAMPKLLYPDNVVHEAILSDGNSHTTEATLDLPEGTYEVWMTTSLWSWFDLDQPMVEVNASGNRTVYVDYVTGNDERNVEGDECRHFATFDIDARGQYDVSVTAGVMNAGFPGSERVYVVEERPSMYAPMQWSGILVMVLGLVGLCIILVLMAMASSEEKKASAPQQPYPQQPYPQQPYPQQPYPQQPYPPPGYAPYPPQQQPPPYPYPQQQPPSYPPPRDQQPSYPPYPPPQGQPPPYQPPPQPPVGRKGRSKY